MTKNKFPFAALSMTFILIFSSPALAGPYTYAPDDCEFTMTFPSEPYLGQRCNPNEPTQCHDVTTFMKVFDLSATLSVNVVCNKAEDGMYEKYSGDIMRTTLIAMAGQDRIEEFETSYDESPEAKVAHILGHGKKGDNDLIYVGQLWIGKKSVLSLEAEVSGDFVQEADDMFAQIMTSVTHKEWAAKAAAEAAKSSEKPAEKAEEEKPADKPADKPKE